MSEFFVLLRSVFIFFLVFASQRTLAADIVVSASIVLQDAFSQIKTEFEEINPQHRLMFNFGAGGLLRSQIEQGAPADVFASAHMGDFEILKKKGIVAENAVKVFARNRIVVVTNGKKEIAVLADLAKPMVKRVAAGNPKTVSVGKYTAEALAFFKLQESMKSKLVFGENARQVLDYAERGEADAAFVFASDALSSKLVTTVFAVDSRAHSPIEHGVAVIEKSKNKVAAKLFVQFILGRGKSILQKHGFE